MVSIRYAPQKDEIGNRLILLFTFIYGWSCEFRNDGTLQNANRIAMSYVR